LQLGAIYDFFIREGQKADVRGAKVVQQVFQAARAEQRGLDRKLRQFFDSERLKNPYSDTRILFGDRKQEIRRVLVGIDIDVAELLLADRLSQSGQKIDLALSHHPSGLALAGLTEVMDMHVDLLTELGLKPEVALDFMAKRKDEVSLRLQSANSERVVDAARILNIPFLCCHTPADNHVTSYLTRKMTRQKPKTLGAVMKLLLREPEYAQAQHYKMGPKILVGKDSDKAGRVVVDMTGGTEGSKDVFPRMSQNGVDTLLVMHLSDGHLSKIKNEHIKVVNAGHIASDNLGMNLLLDKLERQTDIEWVECSGFRRVRR